MRLLAVLAILPVAALSFACDTEDEPRPGATPAVTATAPGNASLTPPPTPSTDCPLERDICGQGQGAFLQIRGLAMSALFHEDATAIPLRDFGGTDRTLAPAEVILVLEKWIARADPKGSDSLGTGEVRIDAVGCRKDEPACETERATALTMMRVDGGVRQALVLVFGGRDTWVERVEMGSHDDLDKTDFDFKPYRYDEGPPFIIPEAGGACPVEQEVCDFAVRIRDTAGQGDVDALMAAAVPTMRRCGDLSFADDICAGLSADTEVPGYGVGGRSGEGGVFSEERFGAMLAERVAAGASAIGRADPYGAATLELAGVACFRLGAEPSECPSHIEVNLTWREPSRSTFDRRVLSLRYEWLDGELALRGFSDRSVISGQDYALYGGSFPASYREGERGELTWFAWRPAE